VRYQPDLVDRIWKRAARLGFADYFVDAAIDPIHDDHVSLLAAGIPTIDIIDFDYPWWHTTGDTPDKCSPQSLQRVGQLLLSLIVDPL
jgi:Zn-dependent M28 family amino/carboxypeptidase